MTTAHALDRLLTPAEVAALVFVDPKTVSRWASAGKIPATRTVGVTAASAAPTSKHSCPGNTSERRTMATPPDLPPGWTPQGSCGAAPSRELCRAAADAVVAGAIALALEAHAEAAAEAVLETATSVFAAAQTMAPVGTRARRADACAAADAARLVAAEAARAAASMRSRATVQARCLAETAAQAKRLALAVGDRDRTTSEALLMAATVMATADAASSDTALAAARVAQAVTDAAAHVAAMVAAFELSQR